MMTPDIAIAISAIIVSGVFACIVLDAFGRLLLLALRVPEPSWAIVGRWVWHMIRHGAIINPGIAEAPPVRGEVAIGWAFHYAIAIAWAVIFHLGFIQFSLGELTYLNGFAFGVTTTIAPLFIFMPFTGQGVSGSKTPQPALTTVILLLRHSVFGVAMMQAFRWFY